MPATKLSLECQPVQPVYLKQLLRALQHATVQVLERRMARLRSPTYGIPFLDMDVPLMAEPGAQRYQMSLDVAMNESTWTAALMRCGDKILAGGAQRLFRLYRGRRVMNQE